jgi:hypothetical protein
VIGDRAINCIIDATGIGSLHRDIDITVQPVHESMPRSTADGEI